jgi:hypothetical protein
MLYYFYFEYLGFNAYGIEKQMNTKITKLIVPFH